MISISRQVPLIFVLSCLVYITTSLVVPLSQSPFISWRKQYSDVSETKSIKVDFQNNIEKSEHIFKIPSCATIPDVPMDRRPWDRNGTLSVMNYNAEWLFYDGGSGSLKCPGPQCPWTVSTFPPHSTTLTQKQIFILFFSFILFYFLDFYKHISSIVFL